jgi:phytoene synthase
MSAVDVQTAYRYCEGVTRSRARNFYYGIRLLPPPKRFALSAVYAFARRVDDIGDGPLEPEDKLDQLAAARAGLDHLSAGDDPVLVALADVSARFPLPLKAFGELIEGVEMDVRGTSYPTFDELAHYCRCVAGSIGRLSLGIFGSRDPEVAQALADKLGIAMQLTNILRDLREDADNGRVYLPKEDLVRFGYDGELTAGGGRTVSGAASVAAMAGASGGGDPGETAASFPDAFVRLIGFQVARAQRFFSEGLCLLPMLDRRSAACVSAMSGIYRELLARIARRPEAVLHERVSVPAWEKARIAARSLLGVSP